MAGPHTGNVVAALSVSGIVVIEESPLVNIEDNDVIVTLFDMIIVDKRRHISVRYPHPRLDFSIRDSSAAFCLLIPNLNRKCLFTERLLQIGILTERIRRSSSICRTGFTEFNFAYLKIIVNQPNHFGIQTSCL